MATAAAAAVSFRAAVPSTSLVARLASASATVMPSQPRRLASLFASQLAAIPLLSAMPAISLSLPSLPSLLGDIWESILRAVPKKKTSHMKKRHRQMAGKALKDVNSLCKCPACGRTKRMHYLCPYCMESADGQISRRHQFHQKPPWFVPSSSWGHLFVEFSAKFLLQSKQYYIARAVENAHETDIFSVAVTQHAVISGSGGSTLRVHSTDSAEYPIVQSIDGAHKLGCHHVATGRGGSGRVACSAGFGGEVQLWRLSEAGDWSLQTQLRPSDLGSGGSGNGAPTGDAWALALSHDEQYLAYTTHDGRVGVWDLAAGSRLLVYSAHNRATSSFAMSVDLSQDGRYTAVGYQSGAVNVFDNDASKLVHALPGLARPVRAVAFSPLGRRLAAAGDAGVIAIYDMKHGEPVANLTPPGGSASMATSGSGSSGPSAPSDVLSSVWVMSLDFSAGGEHLLAGYMDGKVRVWNVELGTCVATCGDAEMATLWSVRWLPPRSDRPGADTESFCTAGADRRLTFYREAGSNSII
ncbi:meiotic recombination protein ski8 [Grosmannia clavigera kw1407]|uniref:Meiotic recombination protein ski8 n=1 Tax=Grosmannia clavigera (strain kw1407 / UAMH 11150) TaxID=655863 RepID=F0X7K7_GROCL|nr:meiotic recombination protein ski8 [Grosmannia clavigera kw1407]EFX06608.1 meiotic recombination protein ski8 [Grosmannia clavigera kw1407]